MTTYTERSTQTVPQIIVIGAGYAGLLAARRLALKTEASDRSITLINQRETFAERTRFHQIASNQSPKLHQIRDLLPDDVQFAAGHVTTIDPDTRRVTFITDDGPTTRAFDYLVYALGSTIDMEQVPGVAEHAYGLRQPDLATLQEKLPAVAKQHGQLVICGGGFTGIEAATEFAEQYPNLNVILVTRERFGEEFSNKGQRYLQQVFKQLNIKVIDQQTVTAVEETYLQTAAGKTIRYDLCLWAGAFRVPSLAAEMGLPVNEQGQMVVNRYLQSSTHPHIYAVGDAAYMPHQPLRMACATAMPMGAYAADHLAAHINQEPAPDAFSFSYTLQCISLGRHDALVQWVRADDSPREWIITGRLGALIKEGILRFTIWSIRWARFYTWRQGETPSTNTIGEVSHELSGRNI